MVTLKWGFKTPTSVFRVSSHGCVDRRWLQRGYVCQIPCWAAESTQPTWHSSHSSPGWPKSLFLLQNSVSWGLTVALLNCNTKTLTKFAKIIHKNVHDHWSLKTRPFICVFKYFESRALSHALGEGNLSEAYQNYIPVTAFVMTALFHHLKWSLWISEQSHMWPSWWN